MTDHLKQRRLFHELDTVVKAIEGFMERVDTESLADGLLHDRVKSALVTLRLELMLRTTQAGYVNKPAKPEAVHRSAVTGKFVSAGHALENLATTVRQTLRRRKP